MTPTLCWSEIGRSATAKPCFPVDQPSSRCQYTFNGSAAIHAAVQDMQLEQGVSVLLPAYCCGAELEPFERLDCALYFYDIGTDFSARRDDVERLLRAQPEIQVMLLTHYLGFAQPEVEAIAEQCRLHQVCLIEDCAHALYTEQGGRAVGQAADYAIFSMRKSLPLSEGGALVANRGLSGKTLENGKSLSMVAGLNRIAYSFQQGARSGRVEGVASLYRYFTLAIWLVPALIIKMVRLTGLVQASRWLTPDVEGPAAYPVYGQGMSSFSRRLLERANGDDIRRQRRDNHACWVSLTAGIDGVDIVNAELPEGACPLYFLVQVRNPGECVRQLAELDIEAFNWWQHLSEAIRWPDFPVAWKFKQSLLALPLHQQLEQADIIHMAHCLSRVVGSAHEHPENES